MVLCGISFFIHAQTWVNLGSPVPKEISAIVTESNSQTIRVLFSTRGFYSESINEGNVTYQRLSIPKASRSQTIGFPELPLFRQMVAIPECSDVSLSFQVLQEQVLNNYNVYPAPDHQVITNPDSTCYVAEVFSKNALCYVDNLVSPSNNVELSETGHFRSQKYAEIQVSPIRYNPATQKLYVAKEIEVTLTLTNATGTTSANLGIFNNVAAHTMLNYESTGMTAEANDMRFDGGSVTFYNLQSTNDAEDINVDYLIICANQFINVGVGGVLKPSDELQSFARYRAYYNGYDVGIVSVNNILELDFQYTATNYHTICEEKMRSFLSIVYENGNASHTYDGHLGFVLLVGRAPDGLPNPPQTPYFYNGYVPTSYSHGVSYHENNYTVTYPSDYFFSCIQSDHVGDFFIGRFCVEDEFQLHNIVTKTMKREREYRPKESKVMDFAKGRDLSFDYSLYCSNMCVLLGTDKVLDSVIFDIENGDYRNKVFEMLTKGSPFFTIFNHAWSEYWEDLKCKYLLSSLPYGETSTPLYSEVKEQEEEFYTCTKWYDSKINFVRYSNHFKDVEVVRMMDTQQNEPDNLVIYDWDIIQDATAGVVYGVDHNLHTDSAYVSTDFGHTWTAISLSRVDNHPVYFWTFPNSPGVIAKGNQWSDFQVSNDFGSHFEAMETGPLSNCFSGWSSGEFFDLFWQVDKGMMLHRTPDYYQTLETINQMLPEYHWNYLGAVEGEFYKLYYAGPESNEARLYYSDDYGQNCRLLMEFDSTAVSTPLHGEGLWSVWIGREPGVFYTYKREYRYDASEEGTKIYINYYRSYGDTLVTTYFHHFAPDWFDHHTPVMECEIVCCDNSGVTLHWTEPELRPEEVLVGYRVYRGETLISGDLITETEFIDNYSGNGRLKYHVLAVYSDGETSKSYNIVYCEKTESIQDKDFKDVITVSPNPTNSFVCIEGTNVVEVRVYNALGQMVKTVRNSNEVHLENLPTGLYTLRISTEKGKTVNKKVVLK